MKKSSIQSLLETLNKHFQSERKTTLNRMKQEKDPFKVLIGCIVSINIKDEVTEKILAELFAKADSFETLLQMDTEELETILYLARYRRVKAATLQSVSREIIERFNGQVPSTKDKLLSIKGIGPKTANVVLNFAFDQAFIPVDSNTLRIVNRIGWIRTENHEEVEKLLVKNLDKDFLKDANAIFMLHGKQICVPASPFCSTCPIDKQCLKVGVARVR
ncbi:MAG: endonuclease [archaeon]